MSGEIDNTDRTLITQGDCGDQIKPSDNLATVAFIGAWPLSVLAQTATDSLTRDLVLELGERQQHVQRQASHRAYSPFSRSGDVRYRGQNPAERAPAWARRLGRRTP